jgi:proteasome beta subunit
MEDNINDIVKKGTTTVGIVCKDGIILAADKRATFAGRIIANKDVDKIFKISENMAITTAGTVSDVQLITKLIKAELTLIRIRTGSDPSVKTTANLLGTIVYQNIRKFSPILGITGFILGGRDASGFYLYELGPDGSVLEHKNYATDGSGMMMAWGVLDTLYKDGINTNEGIKLAVKAVNAAIQRDAATGEAIDVYTIKTDGVKKVLTKKLETNIII